MNGPVTVLVLVFLWLAFAGLMSGCVAVVAGVLAYREGSTTAVVWGRAGMAFAVTMGVLVAVGEVVRSVLQGV
ncbi:hypothetical protein [Streptomyces sp. NPDC088246]|uniref:hypothetical protein n=1 Tax=Streptomyces sp. NPDC088246 TaxID=3365842 RepID=UPI0037FFF632